MSQTSTKWSAKGHVATHGATEGTLYIYPDNISGDQFAVYRRQDVSDEEMLAVADRVLAGVQDWRDRIAVHVESNRTVTSELEAAKVRIAELVAAAEGSDS
jgi:capsid protein